MTKMLLILTVLLMFFLVGLTLYESYRSTEEVQAETTDDQPEEITEFEIPQNGEITYSMSQGYGR